MKNHIKLIGTAVYKNGKEFRLIENGKDYVTGVASDGSILTRNHYDGTYRGAKCPAGYFQTRIRNRTVYVHSLVFEAFVGPVPDGYEIDHINTDRSDNRLENLRVVTHTDNMRNETTVKNSRGIRLENAKRASDARKIVVFGRKKDGSTIGPFESIAEAAKITGVNHTNISSVVLGKLRTAGGIEWFKIGVEEVSE